MEGKGGAGGRLGWRSSFAPCEMSEPRTDGNPGSDGSRGVDGAVGEAGAPGFTMNVPITTDDFREQLTKPALVRADPDTATAGTTVTLDTLRLLPDDVLLVDGDPVAMNRLSDTLAVFQLPVTRGGYRTLQLRQADGTLSNSLSLYVLPQVTQVGDGGRIKPGSMVTVTGSGFADGARVRVNGEDMPDCSFVNGATMTFTLRRPVSTPENADGEPGVCEIILADGQASNSVQFVIDTLRIVVIGDSVAWGQGLRLHEKWVTLIEKELARRGSGIKAYTSMLAHSGATIGVGDTTVLPPLEGEVPTSYPTALQQLNTFAGAADSVDLVLVSAGLNDVNFRTFIDPTATPQDFRDAVDLHCRRDLRTLLATAAARFPKATLVATAYYPIISEDSDTTMISALAAAIGITVGVAAGGAVGGAVAPVDPVLGGLAGPIGGVIGGVVFAQAVPRMIANCRAFHEMSTVAIAAAVQDTNDLLDTPQVLFADPGFGTENAALASQAWLYGVNGDLSPQDPFVVGERSAACELHPDRADGFQCVRASAGHPNPAGAQAYADAVLRALDAGPADENAQEAALPRFPDGFLFGVATAAMQNEGGITNNDWAAFSSSSAIRERVRAFSAKGGPPVELSEPGDAIRHADLDVLRADLDRAAALGLNSYRFSVEWARIQPQSAGHGGALTDADLDMAAVAYYDAVLDELEARGLVPVVTLHHLTLPLWVLDPPKESTVLSAVGLPTASPDDPDFAASLRGWENPVTVDAFVAFTRYLTERWAGRVRWWITLNEPVGSIIGVGYVASIWPPGFAGDGARAKRAYFNLIRAHVRAYETIKAADPDSQVGLAHAMLHAKVTTAQPDGPVGDQDAARNQFDYFYNWHLLEAIVEGRLDTAIHRRPGNRVIVEGADLSDFLGIDPAAPWKSHCDFVGLNYYRSVYVYADLMISALAGFTGGMFINNLSGGDQVHQTLNDLGWEISPSGFGSLLRDLHTRYGLPVLVTENGVPQAEDQMRGAFLTAHLTELLSAVRDGVDVRGYLYWTLADNWEWHEGYRPQARFGLFTVDRADPGQRRTPTDGAHAYSYVISRGDLHGARDLFGTISPSGDRVRPPRRSPAVLTGTLDGHPCTLTLRIDPQGWTRGLLSELTNGRTTHLTGTWDTTSGVLTLEHGSPHFLLVAKYATALTGNWTFTGTMKRDGATLDWQAHRDGPAGEWSAVGPLPRLKLFRSAGIWSGAWLPEELPRQWRPLQVSVDGTQVTLEGDGRRVSAVLAPGTLSGNLNYGGTSTPWLARRLPDGFPV
ncbi:hypothetical protein DMH26_17650 [Streptomyces sp. WAC 05379]|nr:hypothetical protein DMH26_17650 [Streptomyces sp. WAC 05379]